MATAKSHNGLNRGVADPLGDADIAESDDIRRDIDRTRGEMDRTIDELSERLRPRNLFDDLVDSVRCSVLGPGTTASGQQRLVSEQVTEAAGQAGRTLIEAVRENPVPAALVGAGLAWLLFEDKAERAYRRHRVESNLRGYTGNRYTDPGTYSGSYVDARTGRPYDESYGAGYRDTDYDGEPDVRPPSMTGRARGAASTVRGAVSSTAGAVGTAASSVVEALGTAAHAVGDVAGRAVEGAKSLAGTTAHAASAAGRGVRSAGQSIGEFGRSAGSSARTAGESLRDYGAAAAGSIRDAGSAAREYGGSAAGSVRSASRSAASSVADFSHSTVDSVRTYRRKAGEGVQQGYAMSRERFSDALDDKPLAVGVAALAAGLLAGLALPNTRVEDRTLGRRSDRLKDEARRRAQEAFDQGKEVVAHVADAAIGEAEGAGLVPGSLGEKVARVAKDALSAAQESARREGIAPETIAEKASQVAQAVKEKGKEELKQAAPAALTGGSGSSGGAGASAGLGPSDLGTEDFGTGLTGDAGRTGSSSSSSKGQGDMSAVKDDAEVKHDIAEGMSAPSKSKGARKS